MNGEAIREAREARGWSQAKLAAMVGTKQQTVHRLERDEVTWSRYRDDIVAALLDSKPRSDQAAAAATVIPHQAEISVHVLGDGVSIDQESEGDGSSSVYIAGRANLDLLIAALQAARLKLSAGDA